MNIPRTPFESGTKNDAIFRTNAPYDNHCQGSAPRWLFVCSAGLLRSPTGATLAALWGINARSCGSATHYALIPISANLINWANKIVFVNKQNYFDALDVFVGMPDLLDQIDAKEITLNIQDIYNYMEPRLVEHFEKQLFNVHAPKTA